MKELISYRPDAVSNLFLFTSKGISPMKVGIVVAGLFAVLAFLTGAFVSSPELRAFAANTVGSIDIIDESIQSVDIKNGQVKNADIAANAVTSGKIKDGEVKPADLANSAITASKVDNTFMVHRTLRDDPAGNAAGWNPDGGFLSFIIWDPMFDATTSVVVVNTNDNTAFNSCSIDYRDPTSSPDAFEINCVVDDFGTGAPSEGSTLDYILINMPATSMPASSGLSASTSEDRPQRSK